MSEKISYDPEYDILYVHKGPKEADSLSFGDFTVEFSHRDRVIGVEVMNASENISLWLDRDIGPEQIAELVEADFALHERHGMAVVFLNFVLLLEDQEEVKGKMSVNMPDAVPQLPG